MAARPGFLRRALAELNTTEELGPEKAAALAARTAPSVRASQAPYLTGLRIRYGTPGAPGVSRVARVLRVAPDTLLVMRDQVGAAPERLDPDTLLDFEVSRGWERHTRGGALIGSIAGCGRRGRVGLRQRVPG